MSNVVVVVVCPFKMEESEKARLQSERDLLNVRLASQSDIMRLHDMEIAKVRILVCNIF